jgi:multidrug efflux pump subunit AcrA (membrane-fusion protein)
MGGDADIVISEKHNVPVLPISTLIDESHVYVKTKKGFEERTIRTGIQGDTEVEILSGLEEGDQVALQPEEAEKVVKK